MIIQPLMDIILRSDGSDVNIPFIILKQKPKSMMQSLSQYHVNALYDCINKVFL